MPRWRQAPSRSHFPPALRPRRRGAPARGRRTVLRTAVSNTVSTTNAVTSTAPSLRRQIPRRDASDSSHEDRRRVGDGARLFSGVQICVRLARSAGSRIRFTAAGLERARPDVGGGGGGGGHPGAPLERSKRRSSWPGDSPETSLDRRTGRAAQLTRDGIPAQPPTNPGHVTTSLRGRRRVPRRTDRMCPRSIRENALDRITATV